MRTVLYSGLATALCFGALGCEDEPKRVPKAELSAEPQGAGVDPEIAQAVAAVSANAGNAAPVANPDGPPPTGIFAPGMADKKQKRNQPAKIEFGSAGDTPLVISTQPKPGQKQKLMTRVGFKPSPRSSQLNVDMSLELEVQKRAEGVTTGPLTVKGEITSAKAAASLTGIPKELGDKIAKLKGTTVEYLIAANGGAYAMKVTLPKDGPVDLADLARTVGEAIIGLTLPFPTQAVGTGGVWMASQRGTRMGVDTLSYRMVKLDKAVGGSLELQVSGKHYAADSNINLGAAAPGVNPVMDQFQSETKTLMSAQPGVMILASGQYETTTSISLHDTANPQARMSLQAGAKVTFIDEELAKQLEANPPPPRPGAPRGPGGARRGPGAPGGPGAPRGPGGPGGPR